MCKHSKTEIGAIIKRLRISSKETQSDLAAFLMTTQQSVARWEKGEAQPDLDTFFRLCDHFEIYDVLHTFGYGDRTFPSFDSKELLNHPYFRLIFNYCHSTGKDSKDIFNYFFSPNHSGNPMYIFSNGKPNPVDESAIAKKLGLSSLDSIYSWGIANGLWPKDNPKPSSYADLDPDDQRLADGFVEGLLTKDKYKKKASAG